MWCKPMFYPSNPNIPHHLITFFRISITTHNQSLQKNGSKATFLKRGHRDKKRGYSLIWPIATFFKAA